MKQFATLFLLLLVLVMSTPGASTAQSTTVLSADGPGNTYELINSVLAPGYLAVEAPDASHAGFGRHITEVFDNTLNKNVFQFNLHLTPDNDPSTGSPDRQRVEIKTYDQSPANLIGKVGESITYKWKFMVPTGFQPSSNFTHIHQIKPVGGDDDTPIFTLTLRKGTPNRLELLYVTATTTPSQRVAAVNLSAIENTWVEATEFIQVDSVGGKYAIEIKRVSDGVVLLSYSNQNALTIRGDNNFIRPKWGIYRSLLTPGDLRDEALRFADFSISEGTPAPLLGQTYYWVGGTAISSFSSNSNWNTLLNGSGVSRSVAGAQTDDILIFDGSNIGGATPTTGVVTTTLSSNTIGQLKLQNNANVVFQRVPAGGGTGTLAIGGDGSPAPDFVVAAGSSLTLNSPLVDGNVVIAMDANATGLIGGTITLSNTGTHRITSQAAGALVFSNGSTFNSAGTPATSAYPFGSSSQGVQFGVVFEAGANLVVTGNRSPFGGTSTFQAANMLPGSNFYMKTTNATGTGSYTNQKNFGNVFVQTNSTFTCDGGINKIENLTVDAGSTFITHTSGSTPVLGNVVVNGTIAGQSGSTNIFVLGGSTPQSVTGSGTISVPSFTVASNSDVTLSKTVSVDNSCNIVGKLNFGTTGKLTGSAAFTARVAGSAATVTGNITAGSYQVTAVTGTLSGNVGLNVSGTGVDAGTNVVGISSSAATINLSKPALTTATGVTLTFSSDSATLTNANPAGFDSTNGSVTVTGLKSYQTGTNYVINGTTNWPFGISSTATTALGVGNVTLNSSVSTNYNVRVRGALTLNSGNLTISPSDTVRIVSGAEVGGAPFSSSKYVITGLSGAVAGVLRIESFTTPRLFPVGTATRYLPVTLAPTSEMTFSVNVFEGVTADATPTGTPFTAAQKDKVVDAVWNIGRNAGTGDCNVSLAWPAALEGASFATLSDAEVGISRFNTTDWDIVTGSGSNSANTATAVYSSFGQFSVGQVGFILPLDFKSLSATIRPTGTVLNWQVFNEGAVKTYVVERSTNTVDFKAIGAADAIGKNSYDLTDAARMTGTYYYRIRIVLKSGEVRYSRIVTVKQGGGADISLYPNPVTNTVFVAGLNGTATIRVVNALGQTMLQQKTNASTTTLDASNLVTGFYTIQVLSDGDIVTTKSFVKK